MGKGDKWRPTKLNAYRDNFDEINFATPEKCCKTCEYGDCGVCTHRLNPPMEISEDYKCKYWETRRSKERLENVSEPS